MTIQTPANDRASDFIYYWDVIRRDALEFGRWPWPDPIPEYEFALPAHRYRADWAFPDQMVLVEVDGGRWKPGGGRHATDQDRDRNNFATSQGWRVLHFSPQQLADDPTGCVNMVVAALRWKP
jgi:hypothetical protein